MVYLTLSLNGKYVESRSFDLHPSRGEDGYRAIYSRWCVWGVYYENQSHSFEEAQIKSMPVKALCFIFYPLIKFDRYCIHNKTVVVGAWIQ